MKSKLKQLSADFNKRNLRERGLLALVLIGVLGFVWWTFFAEPKLTQITALQNENSRIGKEIEASRIAVAEIRLRIDNGVHREKTLLLAKLTDELHSVEAQLRDKAEELIDPEKMFGLINQLLYKESNLKLKKLKRREVKPAIPVSTEQSENADVGIYQHVLEMELAGKYLDIVKYMQLLERLDWKLLWDEVEITTDDYPTTTVRLVISTLSTQKEWVGI